MTDFALVFDPVNGCFDFTIENSSLALDSSLAPAVVLSLFCDRVADPDDVIPDGTNNPRGWWGDTPLATATPPATPDYIGSKMWLRFPATATTQTATLLAGDCRAALQWMLDDGVAADIDVTVTLSDTGSAGLDTANITIVITRTDGRVENHVYDALWAASTTPTPLPPVGGALTPGDILGVNFILGESSPG